MTRFEKPEDRIQKLQEELAQAEKEWREQNPNSKRIKQTPPLREGKKPTLPQLILQALEEGPMDRTDVHNSVTKLGWKTSSKDPLHYISSALSSLVRSGEVINEGGLFCLPKDYGLLEERR